MKRPASQTPAVVQVIGGGRIASRTDALVTEEPLEIRVRASSVATMRTPGNDFELAAGFLYSEGVVTASTDISAIRYCVEDEQLFNVVTVDLTTTATLAERPTLISSACGVCGAATIESLRDGGLRPLPDGPAVDSGVLFSLPDTLRQSQRVFDKTGGLHAAALFEASGELVEIREDVGRHNALDKLVGWALLEGRLPLAGHIVLVSGRASFELAQKAVRAGAPILCAVSAPSSMAVDVAREFNLTLVGFLREGRGNVYAGAERIVPGV